MDILDTSVTIIVLVVVGVIVYLFRPEKKVGSASTIAKDDTKKKIK